MAPSFLPQYAGSNDASLSRYIRMIQSFPLLNKEEEYELAKQWRNKKDQQAAQKLVTAHLRLVVKVAMGHRHYGLPVQDLISEGSVGLLQALKNYDPERGFRFSTYALWWIRAAIQEYILQSWSLVKIGTTAAQKKLFFNLTRMKARIQDNTSATHLLPGEATQIAEALSVSQAEVLSMDTRLYQRDLSLNVSASSSEEDTQGEWLTNLKDTSAEDQEVVLSHKQERLYQQTLLLQALSQLTEREQLIFKERWMKDKPTTLEVLAERFSVSKERIRQIESRVLEKIKQKVQDLQNSKSY